MSMNDLNSIKKALAETDKKLVKLCAEIEKRKARGKQYSELTPEEEIYVNNLLKRYNQDQLKRYRLKPIQTHMEIR